MHFLNLFKGSGRKNTFQKRFIVTTLSAGLIYLFVRLFSEVLNNVMSKMEMG